MLCINEYEDDRRWGGILLVDDDTLLFFIGRYDVCSYYLIILLYSRVYNISAFAFNF